MQSQNGCTGMFGSNAQNMQSQNGGGNIFNRNV
jgi:hypothetical protein